MHPFHKSTLASSVSLWYLHVAIDIYNAAIFVFTSLWVPPGKKLREQRLDVSQMVFCCKSQSRNSFHLFLQLFLPFKTIGPSNAKKTCMTFTKFSRIIEMKNKSFFFFFYENKYDWWAWNLEIIEHHIILARSNIPPAKLILGTNTLKFWVTR